MKNIFSLSPRYSKSTSYSSKTKNDMIDNLISSLSSPKTNSDDNNYEMIPKDNHNETEINMSPVWHCSFSKDGKLLASCHGVPEMCVRIWKQEQTMTTTGQKSPITDFENGWTLQATLTGGHERTIRHVQFSPSNKILACASFDGTVSIWEDFTSSSSNEYEDEEDEDGDDDSGWECIAQLEGHENEVKCVAWNESGTLLASCGRDKSVWIWECFLPMDSKSSVSNNNSNNYLSSYGNDNRGGVADDGEFECLAVLHGHTGDVKYILFTPSYGQWGDGDEILLSASYDDTIKCWAEDGGEWYCAASLDSVHSSTIWSLAYATLPSSSSSSSSMSNNTTNLVVVSVSEDSTIALWKCCSVAERKKLEANNGVVTSSGGDGLWTCFGKIHSVHADDLPIYSVSCIPVSHKKLKVATVSSDTSIRIHTCEIVDQDEEESNAVVEEKNEKGITSITTACTNKEDVVVWNAHGQRDVNCVQFHPYESSLIVSAGDDGIIRFWKL